MNEPFHDRFDAGRALAGELERYANDPSGIVLALPRGGVPVGFEVARALGLPLDVFLVRKLGVPGHEELAMGAIASGGVRVLNGSVIEALNIPPEVVNTVAKREMRELERRERAFRDGGPPIDVAGLTVILVDDGLATGSTMRAAIRAVRAMGPRKTVVAVPVAADETCRELRGEVDDFVCAFTPPVLQAVGLWYRDFSQVGDAEVRDLLDRARASAGTGKER